MDSTTLRAPIETLKPKAPISVTKDTLIKDVLNIMRNKRFGCVCITENDSLLGIFTERDVLNKVIGGNLDVNTVKVGEVMTVDPEYLFLDDQIAFALNRMHVGGFRHIPLIDLTGKPTGIISVRDIMNYLIKNIKQQ